MQDDLCSLYSCTMVCMEALKKHGCPLLGLFGVSSVGDSTVADST